MSVGKGGSQHIVIFKMDDFSVGRLAHVVPGIEGILKRISTEQIQIALRSISGDVFAYLIRSDLHPGAIKAAIESPAKSFGRGLDDIDQYPILSGQDSIIVLEIGSEFSAGEGFTRAGTWLQRH